MSDGFVDQHNDDRKRIGFKAFYYILEEIVLKPLKEQISILSEVFEKWKQNQNQTDDVIIWTVKL